MLNCFPFGPEDSSDSTLALSLPPSLWLKTWSDVLPPQSTFHRVRPETWPPVATHVLSPQWMDTWLTTQPRPTRYSSHQSSEDFPCLPSMACMATLLQVDAVPHPLQVSTTAICSFLSVGWLNGPENTGWFPSKVSFHFTGFWFLWVWDCTFSSLAEISFERDKWCVLEFGPFETLLYFALFHKMSMSSIVSGYDQRSWRNWPLDKECKQWVRRWCYKNCW